MTARLQLTEFLDQLLPPLPGVEDASNNGLQVEGRKDVMNMVFGVDACADLFEQAISMSADFIFVHHGLSWSDNFKRLTEITAERLRLLFTNGISLYASHLPLDADPSVGHNFTIARRLGMLDLQTAFNYHGSEIGCLGRLPRPVGLKELCRQLERLLNTTCESFTFGEKKISTLGIVSGGGADSIPECARRGIDCLLTGEIHHQHYHLMSEYRQTAIAAGHYRTEIPGLESVAHAVREHFKIKTTFIELPTGL